jgi:DNA replication protein DnaC
MGNMQVLEPLSTEDDKEEKLKRININQLIMKIIPDKYIDIDCDDNELLNKLINTKKSLFIHGKVGCGKTVLMASIMKDYIRKNNYRTSYIDNGNDRNTDGKWISYPKFVIKLQAMFRDSKSNPHEYATVIANCHGLLAIDDLGAEKITEFVRQITYFIINEREQNMEKMIITSNYSLDQIDAMIDERVSSRIMGMCDIIELKGRDRRFNK